MDERWRFGALVLPTSPEPMTGNSVYYVAPFQEVSSNILQLIATDRSEISCNITHICHATQFAKLLPVFLLSLRPTSHTHVYQH